jgi:hypothetical protein
MPAVNYNSAPPHMEINVISKTDFLLANPGQTFYGLFNVNTGMAYLVAGMPNVGNVPFRRKAVTGLSPYGEPDDGQGGHALAAQLYGLIGGAAMDSLAGFSLMKGQNSRGKLIGKSGNNREVFLFRPDNGQGVGGRLLPPPWTTVLLACCQQTLGYTFDLH